MTDSQFHSRLFTCLVMPALPLALDGQGRLSGRHQRALFEPVLGLAAETINAPLSRPTDASEY